MLTKVVAKMTAITTLAQPLKQNVTCWITTLLSGLMFSPQWSPIVVPWEEGNHISIINLNDW